MVSRDQRIRAFSAKPKYVARLTVDDVLAAMEQRPKPPVVAKSELREQADAAMAGFKGAVTRLPAIDPAERDRAREARRIAKQARKRRSSNIGNEGN